MKLKFLRKLSVRDGKQFYASLSLPKAILDVWASVENVEIEFEDRGTSLGVLTVTPIIDIEE